MISIDTAILKELVTAASTANDAIDNAVDALNRVSTHNDWGCKEKNAINNYCLTNRSKIKSIQENSKNFLSVITQVSSSFEQSEKSISKMFSSVETLLSGALCIPVSTVINGKIHTGTNVTNWSVGMSTIISQWLKDNILGGLAGITPIMRVAVRTFEDPISVCDFQNLDLG